MNPLIEEQQEREKLVHVVTVMIKRLRALGVTQEELEKLVCMVFEEAKEEDDKKRGD